jgi:para-nitrobenzyl esterase
MRRIWAICGTCVLALSLTVPSGAQAATASVSFMSTTGRVSGFIQHGVIEYRGIPFAAAPLGDLRFEPPKPVQPWPTTLQADHWRSACPQVARFNQTDGSLDEDCLYLNVAYTPSAQKRRPVLVWFYGGAYVGGSADLYRLDRLARDTGAIIVAGNYRVGAMGFLSHPALDSNNNAVVGMLDQRAILKWVHHNIARLGGDPSNITIAGESAGAISVCLQLSSPLSQPGDFAKVIIQSGACLTPLPRQADLYPYGLELAHKLGCRDNDVGCLKAQPIAKIIEAQTQITATHPQAFVPAVGSAFMPTAPSMRFHAGNFLHVPILNGANRDEMTLYVGYQVAYGQAIDETNFVESTHSVYADQTPRVLAEYANDPDYLSLTAPQRLGRLESDFVPPGTLSHCLVLSGVDVLAAFTPVYEYEFTDRDGPAQMRPEPFKLGAVHAGELPYLFPHISHNHRLDGADLDANSEQLAKLMLMHWGAFLRTGHPALASHERWPQYHSRGGVFELNPMHSGEIEAQRRHHCEFWRGLYPALLSDD